MSSAYAAGISMSEWPMMADTVYFANCILIVGGIVPLWDYLLTLDLEVELIWCRPRSSMTLLFVVTRVLSIWYALGMLLPVVSWSTAETCKAATLVGMPPILLLELVWATFSALRTYAVGSQATKTAVIVFVLSIAPFAVDLTAYTTSIFIDIPYTSVLTLCGEATTIPVYLVDMLMVAGRVPLIIADLIVLYITCKTTSRIRKESARDHVASPLIRTLVRDGTFSFAAALVVNIFQMVFYINSDNFPIANFFVPTATPMIVTRFLLDLAELRHDSSLRSTLTTSVPTVSMQFAPDLFVQSEPPSFELSTCPPSHLHSDNTVNGPEPSVEPQDARPDTRKEHLATGECSV